jgi:hypothetical protein
MGFLAPALGTLLLTVSVGANAASLSRYTFTGTVTGFSDGAGLAAANNIVVGTAVTYVFDVDTSAAGTISRYGEADQTLVNNSTESYFYTDFISGGLLENGDNPDKSSTGNVSEHNYGLSAGPGFLLLFGESQSEVTSIQASTSDLTSWALASAAAPTLFGGSETAFVGTLSTTIRSTLTLSSVSPVPIPAAAWLFGSALLGFFGLARRKKA